MPTSHAVKNIVLAVLILLPARAVAATAQKAKDCPLQMQASLEFRTLPEGRISIPVKIQGQELFFMIDTGGVVSTLDPVIAARMNLQPNPTPAPLFGVGGVWLNQMVHAQDLAFSRFILDRPVFYLQPPSWRDLSGTMASELLRLFDVDFDFAGGKFNLFSPDHCPGKVVYWTREPVAIVSMLRASQGGHIRIPITVDGKDMTATVDTGATSSVMSLHAAIRYLDIDEKDPQLKTVGVRRQNIWDSRGHNLRKHWPHLVG